MLTTETFRKAARDPAEFGSYYLSHYFTRRSPPFHPAAVRPVASAGDEKPGPSLGLRRHADGKGHPQRHRCPPGPRQKHRHEPAKRPPRRPVRLQALLLLVSDTEARGQLSGRHQKRIRDQRAHFSGLRRAAGQNLEDRLHPALQRLSDRRHRQRPEAAGTAQLRAPPGSHPLR